MSYTTYNGQLASYQGKLVTSTPYSYPLDNLLGRWNFQNNLVDDINSYNYVMYGASNAAYAAGKIGNGLTLQNGDLRMYNASAGLNNALKANVALSYSFWIYFGAAAGGGYSPLFYPGIDSTGGEAKTGIQCRMESTNILSIGIGKDGVSIGDFTSAAMSISTWYHYVYTFSGGANKYQNCYCNSVRFGTQNRIYTGTNIDAGSIWTGQSIPSRTYYDNWGASNILDLVYIYNKELTQTEVDQLYNSGAGI